MPNVSKKINKNNKIIQLKDARTKNLIHFVFFFFYFFQKKVKNFQTWMKDQNDAEKKNLFLLLKIYYYLLLKLISNSAFKFQPEKFLTKKKNENEKNNKKIKGENFQDRSSAKYKLIKEQQTKIVLKAKLSMEIFKSHEMRSVTSTDVSSAHSNFFFFFYFL